MGDQRKRGANGKGGGGGWGPAAHTYQRHTTFTHFLCPTPPPPAPAHRKEALQQEVERLTTILKEAADQQLVRMVDGDEDAGEHA